MNRSTGFTLLSIWIVTVCVVIYYTARATANFRSQASFTQTLAIKPSSTGTFYLKLNDVKYLSSADSARLNVKGRFKGMTLIEDYNENSPGNKIWIDIEKSDVATPILVEAFSARGRNYEQALNSARGIQYQFVQQDSVLKFARTLRRETGALWRNEELHLILKVPLNTKLVIDHAVNDYISNIVDIWSCNDMNQRDNKLPGIFVMTDTGLECFAGPNAKLPEVGSDIENHEADTVIRRTDTIIIRK